MHLPRQKWCVTALNTFKYPSIWWHLSTKQTYHVSDCWDFSKRPTKTPAFHTVGYLTIYASSLFARRRFNKILIFFLSFSAFANALSMFLFLPFRHLWLLFCSQFWTLQVGYTDVCFNFDLIYFFNDSLKTGDPQQWQ